MKVKKTIRKYTIRRVELRHQWYAFSEEFYKLNSQQCPMLCISLEGHGFTKHGQFEQKRFRTRDPGQRGLQFCNDRPDLGDYQRQISNPPAPDTRQGGHICQDDVRTKTTANTGTSTRRLPRR